MKKWRAILRVDGNQLLSTHDYSHVSDEVWEEELEHGMVESLFGGFWVPVEVDEDDVYPF